MIDITPLDVRKKHGDIPRVFRGYDPEEVDTFLEIVADRLEELVKENLTLRERSQRLQEQVKALESRERAVNEALVTAQELSGEIGEQARREARLLRREAEAEIEGIMQKADALLEERKAGLRELERMRTRFLKGLRTLLERELDSVTVEEEAAPGLELGDLELELTSWRERLGLTEAGKEESSPGKPAETPARTEDARSGEPGSPPAREDPRPVDVGELGDRSLPDKGAGASPEEGDPATTRESSPLGDLFDGGSTPGGRSGAGAGGSGQASSDGGGGGEAEEGGQDR